MGMAASQARLLQLTSRLHDIEYKAQNIEGQKIALATQKDELYQKYNDASDARIIQVAMQNDDGTSRFVEANFSTVCGYNPTRQTPPEVVKAFNDKFEDNVLKAHENAKEYLEKH